MEGHVVPQYEKKKQQHLFGVIIYHFKRLYIVSFNIIMRLIGQKHGKLAKQAKFLPKNEKKSKINLNQYFIEINNLI